MVINFQYYKNIYSAVPVCFTTLGSFILDTRSGKYKDIPKAQRPYITPCIICTYRNYKSIEFFTGLMSIDIDHAENAEEVRNWLFNTYPQIVTAFITPSQKGVRALMRIPEAKTVLEFKEYFRALSDELTMDQAMIRPIQPFIYGADPEIQWRHYETCSEWTKRKPEPTPEPIHLEPCTVVGSDANINRIKGIIRAKINSINTNDPRHDNILKIGVYVAGFVKAGYLSQSEAASIITDLLNSNSWIMQGSVRQYKKDVEQSIIYGLLNKQAVYLR